jgi:hypothetical protein
MTKAQIKAIENIRKLAETLHDDMSKYEIKEWEISENEYFVSLVVSVGMKDDEGTMAACFCRDEAQLFIGKRGGIKYPVYKNGRSYTKVFHGYSLLEAVCDQRI